MAPIGIYQAGRLLHNDTKTISVCQMVPEICWETDPQPFAEVFLKKISEKKKKKKW